MSPDIRPNAQTCDTNGEHQEEPRPAGDSAAPPRARRGGGAGAAHREGDVQTGAGSMWETPALLSVLL